MANIPHKHYHVAFQYADNHEPGEYAISGETPAHAAFQLRQHMGERKIKIISITEQK